MTAALTKDEDAFYDQFATDFYTVDGHVVVTEEQQQEAIALAQQAKKTATLECLTSLGDFVVFYEGSGARTHAAIPQSEPCVVTGALHGVNVSHTEESNTAVIEFLRK